jgi:hypothetical protein
MTFRQVYYTSCTRGLRETRGFQIHAATPDIDQKHREAVERLSLYAPPPSFPTRPTEAELKAFPVVLLHEDLGGGTHILAQTRYVGTDYSGRFGNYFTHTLLGDAMAFEQARPLPVELWGSPAWVSTEQADTRLPPMMALEPGTAVTRERVARFLKAPHRARRLPAFLACVEQALETRRRILIVDHEDGQPGGYAAALWIAAASYALPRRLAMRLTFDTYVRNPYQSSALLCGLLGGRDTDFAFASHEVQQQFYVFDFLANVFTANVPEPSNGMRSVVDEFQAGSDGSLAGFLAWLDRVAPETPPKDYEMARYVHAPAAGGDTRAALRWAIPLAKTLDAPRLEKLFDAATKQELPPAEDMVRLREAVAGRSDVHVVERAFLAWYFRYLLPRGPMDLAKSAWVRTADARVCQTVWENPLDALAATDEPRRLALMLRVAEDTGVLEGAWDQVGSAVVAPKLIEPRYDLAAYDQLAEMTLDRIAKGLLDAREWRSNARPRGRFGAPNALLHALAREARKRREQALWVALAMDLGAARDADKSSLVAQLVEEASESRAIDAGEVLTLAIEAAWPHPGPGVGDWRLMLGQQGLQRWRREMLRWAFEDVCRHPSWRDVLQDCAAIVDLVEREAPEIAQGEEAVVQGVVLLAKLDKKPLSATWVQSVQGVLALVSRDRHQEFHKAVLKALWRDVEASDTPERFFELAQCARGFWGPQNSHLVPYDAFRERFKRFRGRDRKLLKSYLVEDRLWTYIGLTPRTSRRGRWWLRPTPLGITPLEGVLGIGVFLAGVTFVALSIVRSPQPGAKLSGEMPTGIPISASSPKPSKSPPPGTSSSARPSSKPSAAPESSIYGGPGTPSPSEPPSSPTPEASKPPEGGSAAARTDGSSRFDWWTGFQLSILQLLSR